MKPKTIISITVISLIVIFAVYQQITIQSLRKQIKPDNTEVIEDNTIIVEANNKIALLEEGVAIYKRAWELSVIRYNEKFDSINYQNPDTADIPQVGEYIPFVPDSTYFNPNFIIETRIAKLEWRWIDRINKYSYDINAEYDYSTCQLYLDPSEVRFEPAKKYTMCVSAIINSKSYGLNLSYDIWRFRIGGSVYLDKEVEPDVGINIGIKF